MNIEIEFQHDMSVYWVRPLPVEFPTYYAIIGYACFRPDRFLIDGSLVFAKDSQALWEILAVLSDLIGLDSARNSVVSLAEGSITWVGVAEENTLASGAPIPLSTFHPGRMAKYGI